MVGHNPWEEEENVCKLYLYYCYYHLCSWVDNARKNNWNQANNTKDLSVSPKKCAIQFLARYYNIQTSLVSRKRGKSKIPADSQSIYLSRFSPKLLPAKLSLYSGHFYGKTDNIFFFLLHKSARHIFAMTWSVSTDICSIYSCTYSAKIDRNRLSLLQRAFPQLGRTVGIWCIGGPEMEN